MEIQPDISPTTVSTEVDRPRYGEPIPAIQVMHRYLIAESDDTVIVMDQHALHESILYEKLRKKVLAGPIDLQPLLVPEPIDLAAEEAAVLIERRETLLTLGIEIEPFGGETVLLTALPASARLRKSRRSATIACHSACRSRNGQANQSQRP